MGLSSEIESVFFDALEKASEAERIAFLDSACAGQAEIRRKVERLLKAHSKLGSFLTNPATEQLTADATLPDVIQLLSPSADEKCVAWPDRNRVEGSENAWFHADQQVLLSFLQPSSNSDSLGRIGHYEVLQVIGLGGFGIVLRAFDEKLRRVVAVKVLGMQFAATPSARMRFLREARSSARVQHENIVQVHAVEEQPLPYLVMEFIHGETLQQRIDRDGPLDTIEVVRIGQQIAEGLAAAHGAGLIHRDIKPANIMIGPSPGSLVKITDFGLCRATDDASLTQSGIIAGTPMFMAPEQLQSGKLDQRTDLFSLGSVLYTICSGLPPFPANNTLAVLKRVAEDTPQPLQDVATEVPEWLCEIITRLHAKQPADRFETAREVADLLRQGLMELRNPGSVPKFSVVTPPERRRDDQSPGDDVLEPISDKIQKAAVGPRVRIAAWPGLAIFSLLVLGLGFAEAGGISNVRGVVIRFLFPKGTLVVQVDDPEVSVKIDGTDLVITGAGVKEIRLSPGDYQVEATKHGKLFRQELVSIIRDGEQVIHVSQESFQDIRLAKGSNEPPFNAPRDAKQQQADWARKLHVPVESTGKSGIKMILIPPVEPYLPRPYYLGKFEVTQEEWSRVMGYAPSMFGPEKEQLAGIDTRRFPVEQVNWFDSVEFCNRLSVQEGLTAYYELTVTQRGGKDVQQIDAAEVKILGGNGYHIPTEQEWDHGCRAGMQGLYHFGDNAADLREYCWFLDNSDNRTHVVGQKKPNAFGLYDVLGNVREWNEDIVINVATGKPERINRGGAWAHPAERCAVNHRASFPPAQRNPYGLRLARALPNVAEP